MKIKTNVKRFLVFILMLTIINVNIGNGYAIASLVPSIEIISPTGMEKCLGKIDIIGRINYPGTGNITVKYQIEDMGGKILLGPDIIIRNLVSNEEKVQFMKEGVDISGASLVSDNHYILKVFLETENEEVKISSIGAGALRSMVLKKDGSVWAWGFNQFGELGDGTTTHRYTSVQVSGLTNVSSIATGRFHNLALKNDGTVWSWGHNRYGQLGDGTKYDKHAPVEVSGLTNVSGIAAGGDISLALKTDGTVWSWGKNDEGELGDGTINDSYTPVQVRGLTNVSSIITGYNQSFAFKNDGTVWAWGYNGNGLLGDGTTNDRYSPVQVPNLTNVKAIVTGGFNSMALKEDGTVWTWGNNVFGQLGREGTDANYTPTQVTGITNVISIAKGAFHSLVLKNDGTVWTWGSNGDGQLGKGADNNQAREVSNLQPTLSTMDYRHTPVQVSGITNVAGIAAGDYHSLVLKSDGTLWAWGYNGNGQLGDGTAINRYSPVKTDFAVEEQKIEKAIEFIKVDNTLPKNVDDMLTMITFEVPENNEITYQALVNIIVNNNQSGIAKYRYKWICNPPEKLIGKIIVNEDLDVYMNDWKTVIGKQNTITEQTIFRENGNWYLFAQAVDNNGDKISVKLDKKIKFDMLAPKVPAINVNIDNNNMINVSWTKFQEYTQKELDKINSPEGYTYETSIGTTVTIQSGGENIDMISSGFGEMRLYVQKWGKIDNNENNGWYNILKDKQYIRITNAEKISEIITNALVIEEINKKGARYRVSIRHIDKATLDYITKHDIIDKWDKSAVPQKFKDTILEGGTVVNIGDIGNISYSGWKEVSAIGLKFTQTLDELRQRIVELKKKTIEKFKDVDKNEWYLENVAILTEMNIITGYDDMSFKPNNTITKAQFIKLVITALGYKDVPIGKQYWASEYIEKAFSEGLIENKYSEGQNYDAPITRGEMAIIIAKILKDEPSNEEIIKYAEEIQDFDKIGRQDRLYIIQTYKNKIIQGYLDGEFKPNNNATRAEASTIIVRLLEKE